MSFSKKFLIELILISFLISFALLLIRLLVGVPLWNSIVQKSEEFVKKTILIPQEAIREDYQFSYSTSWTDQSSEAKIDVQWQPVSYGSNFEITINSVIPAEKYGIKIGQIISSETNTNIDKDQLTVIEKITSDQRLQGAIETSKTELHSELKFDESDGLREITTWSSGTRMVFEKIKMPGDLGSNYRKLKLFLPQSVESFSFWQFQFSRERLGQLLVYPTSFLLGFQLVKMPVIFLIELMPFLALPITFFVIIKFQRFQNWFWANLIFFSSILLLTELSGWILFFVGILFYSTG